jgi:hypothetical protein
MDHLYQIQTSISHESDVKDLKVTRNINKWQLKIRLSNRNPQSEKGESFGYLFRAERRHSFENTVPYWWKVSCLSEYLNEN